MGASNERRKFFICSVDNFNEEDCAVVDILVVIRFEAFWEEAGSLESKAFILTFFDKMNASA